MSKYRVTYFDKKFNTYSPNEISVKSKIKTVKKTMVKIKNSQMVFGNIKKENIV